MAREYTEITRRLCPNSLEKRSQNGAKSSLAKPFWGIGVVLAVLGVPGKVLGAAWGGLLRLLGGLVALLGAALTPKIAPTWP